MFLAVLHIILKAAEKISLAMSNMPWSEVGTWAPLKIDALGLISLLGATEVNVKIGTLQVHRLTEWLPLLAAFVVCSDDFVKEQQGYTLYNLTDGICTTELKGWFTRWLSCQRISNSTTIFRWTISASERRHHRSDHVSRVIAFLLVTPMIFSTILMGDWYGVANAASLVLLVLTRQHMLWQRRRALNNAARSLYVPPPKMSKDSVQRMPTLPDPDETIKIIVTRADGRMVTMYTPRSVLFSMVRSAPLDHVQLYYAAQWIGWLAFGVHIIVLGMSSLFTQTYTVVLLVIGTWFYCIDSSIDIPGTSKNMLSSDGINCVKTTTAITEQLLVEQETPSTEEDLADKRTSAYSRLRLSDMQQAMLKHWSLLPFDNELWYRDFEALKSRHNHATQKKALTKVDPVDTTEKTTGQP